MRILGIDYGKKRVGLALSDPLMITAQPHSVLVNDKTLLEKIADIIRRSDVSKVVMGLPVSLDGSIGISAEKVKDFGAKLCALTGMPVEYMDERMTTAQVDKQMIDDGVRRDRRRSVVDKIAAAVMLQSYMDRKK